MEYNNIVASKLYTYFTTKLGMVDYRRGWLKGDCPQCGKEFKYGVQLEDNRTNCFSCGYNSKPLKVVYDTEGFTQFNQVFKLLKDLEGYVTFNIAKPQEYKKTLDFYLPEEYKLIGLGTGTTAKIVEKNLKSRGFTIRKLQRAGVGYCTSGPYRGRIILPYYIDGKLVYFNARKFIDVGPKFKNPTEEEAGIGKTRLIYNHDSLFIYKKVYLFESVTNCLTIGQKATGTGGKSLSPWQLQQYIKSPCKYVVIGLDDDAIKEAAEIGMALAPHKKVKILQFPKGEDANKIGRKATLELEKNTPYMNYQDCYKLYINARTFNPR